MRLVECGQATPEWWAARQGIPTASNFHRIYAVGTRKLSRGIDAYIDELLDERAMQLPNYFSGAGKPTTPAMQRGIDLEPTARAWYAGTIGLRVYQVGFCLTDCGRFGGSPDAFVGDDGGAEVKIYADSVHAKWLADGILPLEHAAQVHGYLIVTGRSWWDFVAWSETHRPLVVRTEPNETTKELRVALERFSERFQKAIKQRGRP